MAYTPSFTPSHGSMSLSALLKVYLNRSGCNYIVPVDYHQPSSLDDTSREILYCTKCKVSFKIAFEQTLDVADQFIKEHKHPIPVSGF